MKYAKSEVDEAMRTLKETLKPGDTVFTILRHVSRSGMMRHISLKLLRGDTPQDLTWLAARVLGDTMAPNNGGLKVGGCGMDMGFHIVFNLSRVVFRDGFKCVGDNCPANDHFNREKVRKGQLHSDPGYALKQRWM